MKCLRLHELIKNKYGSLLPIQLGNFKGALLVLRGYSVRNMTGGPTYFSGYKKLQCQYFGGLKNLLVIFSSSSLASSRLVNHHTTHNLFHTLKLSPGN